MPPSAAAGLQANGSTPAIAAATQAVLQQLRLNKGVTRLVKWKETAERYGVNVTTLRNHVEAVRNRAPLRIGAGRPTNLPESAEAKLAAWLQRQYDAEASVSIDDVRLKAKELAGVYKRQFDGEGGMPSPDWVRAFRQRWGITKRKPQPRGTERLVTPQRLAAAEDLFSKWETALDMVCTHRGGRPVTYRQAPHRILNLDEGPAQRNIGCSYVLVPKGARNAPKASHATKGESATLIAWGTALGERLSSCYIFCGAEHRQNYAEHGDPYTAVLVKPDNHLTDGRALAALFPHLAAALPGGVSPTNRALLLLDHHSSRLDPEAVQAARQQGFDILLLPGQLTHRLQPWDQCFAACKRAYRRVYDRWLAENGADAPFDRATWVRLLTQAQQEAFAKNPQLLANAWEKCGLWPYDPEKALAPMRAALAAQQAQQAGGAPAAAAAQPGSSQTAAKHASKLGTAAAAGQASPDPATVAAVLAVRPPLRHQNGARTKAVKQRLSAIFVTSDEYVAVLEEAAAAKRQKLEAAAERKAAREAAKAAKAAAAQSGAAAQHAQHATAGAAVPRRARRAAALPR